MSAPLWLAWRELASRRLRLALSAGAVAAAVALCVAIELVSRAREDAVGAQIDQIGPSLRIVPEGVTASALARYGFGQKMLPPGIVDAVRRSMGDMRALEARLVIEGLVAGRSSPIIGVPTDARSDQATRSLGPSDVALGSALAERTGAKAGDVVSVGRERYRVSAILPSTAGADDLAAHVPLARLQEQFGLPGALNEVRLYLRPGASPQGAAAAARAAFPHLQVVRNDRGEVAERGVQESLERHRRLVYAVTAVVAGLCLLIAAHLDASERRAEMATLVAIGGSGWTVLQAIVARSALVGALGAVAGVAVGAAGALAQDPAATVLAASGVLGLLAVGAAVAAGALAAGPVALLAARRDPVADLQEVQ